MTDLNRAEKRRQWRHDNDLCRNLGVPELTFEQWQEYGRLADEEAAQEAAEILADPETMQAIAEAEQEKFEHEIAAHIGYEGPEGEYNPSHPAAGATRVTYDEALKEIDGKA